MATHTFGGTALSAAVYSRLTTHALTSAYSNYVYVPSTATFPYNVITGIIGGKSPDFTSRDIKGEDLVIHVHVWSAAQSDSDCATRMNNIVQAITGTDLSITGYTTLKGIYDFGQVMLDDSNAAQILRHGVLRFRFQVA